jgi:general secretion pathway protein K
MWISDLRQKATQGSALLAVLWLSAALATIAISLADTVRGETERSATALDGLRAENLAVGGLRRGILYMDWGRAHPDNPQFKPPQSYFTFNFPEGQARVEVIPETAKLDINQADPVDLLHLLIALGAGEARSQDIVAAIVDWRTGQPAGPSAFDGFYGSLRPPYRAPHENFQEIEELLAVKGVTPDLFYGDWQPTPEGAPQRLVPRNGLRDCLSVYGSTSQFDVNTAPPAVLAAAGVPPEGIAALVQQRRVQAFLTMDDLTPFAGIAGPGYARLTIGGNTIFTLRSTARIRLANGQLSDMRRTVAALVKLVPPGNDPSPRILRWYDNVTAGQ